MKIAVVGAGIGGLAFAVAARQKGHEVTVLERRAAFSDEGAGIVLGPNVMAALAPLNLAQEIIKAARPVQEMRITDAKGVLLARTRYRSASLPHSAQAIHRSRLHHILRDAFDGTLLLNTAVRSVEPGTIHLEEAKITADLIVGADGIRSSVREALHPGLQPRYSGTTCWRFVAEGCWSDHVTEMWGVGKRVGVVPLAADQTYVFLTLNAPRRAPAPFQTLEEFRQLWAEFKGPARGALDSLDDLAKLLHNDLEDGLPQTWQKPGVVLIGDAAHAVTPNLGQGAGLAIEDACCLASLLEQPRALERYEKLRRPRASWILDRSYSVGKMAQLQAPWLCWLRNKAVSWTPGWVNQAAMQRIIHDMSGVPVENGTVTAQTRPSLHKAEPLGHLNYLLKERRQPDTAFLPRKLFQRRDL